MRGCCCRKSTYVKVGWALGARIKLLAGCLGTRVDVGSRIDRCVQPFGATSNANLSTLPFGQGPPLAPRFWACKCSSIGGHNSALSIRTNLSFEYSIRTLGTRVIPHRFYRRGNWLCVVGGTDTLAPFRCSNDTLGTPEGCLPSPSDSEARRAQSPPAGFGSRGVDSA